MHRDASLATLADAVEAVSSRYAERFGITRNPDWCMLKLTEELDELTQAHLKRSGQARADGQASDFDRRFEDEMADVLGQLLVLAKLSGTDLYAALDRKWLRWHPDRLSQEAYQATPPDTSLERTPER
jgi:NTP pyrophosphatase (non-canonical NTP hydrolase)